MLFLLLVILARSPRAQKKAYADENNLFLQKKTETGKKMSAVLFP